MRSIALIPHLGKPQTFTTCTSAAEVLATLGARVLVAPTASRAVDLPGAVVLDDEDLVAASDCAIVIGGDGAMLSAARWLAPAGVPMLGVNLGHLGFLTQVEAGELALALGRLTSGQYILHERAMVTAAVTRNGSTVAELLALNDVVINKGALARIISLTMSVGGQAVATYRADGLIVATPTGSTAYSLSAGGPIVSPSITALIITPICPHSMTSRPIVAAGDEVVQIDVDSVHDEIILTADGQVCQPLLTGDSITARIAPFPVKLLDVMNRGFYRLLRNRVREGRL